MVKHEEDHRPVLTDAEKVARDISPDFIWNAEDASIFEQLLWREGSPSAIQFFARHQRRLTHYGYWFGLGTLWVHYTGFSDLTLWRRLFSSDRPHRETSLMKPSELVAFRALPDRMTVYRARRPGETDWINYTLDRRIAERLATARHGPIKQYWVQRRNVLALFLRRGELEILVLNPALVEESES